MGVSEMMDHSDVYFHKRLIFARVVCPPTWKNVSVRGVRIFLVL